MSYYFLFMILRSYSWYNFWYFSSSSFNVFCSILNLTYKSTPVWFINLVFSNSSSLWLLPKKFLPFFNLSIVLTSFWILSNYKSLTFMVISLSIEKFKLPMPSVFNYLIFINVVSIIGSYEYASVL